MKGSDIKKIRSYLRDFDPTFFFEWLCIISTHSYNQEYLVRVELLSAIFLSIKESDFSKKLRSRSDIVDFFKFFENYKSYFSIIEDYTPWDQRKLIPIFNEGRKFYFFYGLLENPYTRMKVLKNLLFDFDPGNHKDLKRLLTEFELSLNIQTSILEKIREQYFPKQVTSKIYIPSQQYFKNVSPCFINTNKKSKANHLGDFPNDSNVIMNTCFNYEIYQKLESAFLIIGEKEYLFLPHLHIEYFGWSFKTIINKSDSYLEIWEEIYEELQSRLSKICLRFFDISSALTSISVNDKDLFINDQLNSAFLVDENKLVIFLAIRHSENKAIGGKTFLFDEVNNEISKMNGILHSANVTLTEYNSQRSILFPKGDLEVWYVIVHEKISMEGYSLSINKNGPKNHIVEIGDLDFILEYLFDKRKTKAPVDFIKFLQNDRDFFNTPHRIITTNYLDRVSMYLSGEYYYLKNGKSPDFMTIAPYQGNEFESEYFFEKYQKPIYEIVEKKFPNKFDVIEEIEDNTYRLFDIINRHLLYLVQLDNYPVYLYPPLKFLTLERHEKEVITMMLPELFCFYLNELSKDFIAILKECRIFADEFSILLTSNLALEQQENRIPFLTKYLPELNNLPLIVKTHKLTNGVIRSFIIINTKQFEIFLDLFKPENNSAEKLCVKMLIYSLYKYSGIAISEAHIDQRLDLLIPDSKKSFSYNLMKTVSPKLDDYDSPIEVNNSDIGKANKLFAEHLCNKNIKPGEYTGQIAKEINGQIFDFLQQLLENNIKTFKEDILFYAYQQLEFIEGKRELSSLKFGMRSDRAIRYNLKEAARNEIESLAVLASYAKHIIQTTLKVRPTGEKVITESDWTFLLGITAALIETTQIYEYINYDLSPHKLIITGIYEVRSEKMMEKIDHKKWQDELIENRIENYKQKYDDATDFSEEEKSEKANYEDKSDTSFSISDKLQALDEVHYNEFGYKLSTQLRLLFGLQRSNFINPDYFPLSVVSKAEIFDFINEFYLDVNREELDKAIEDIALSYESYNQNDLMIPTELLRSKKRINVCPLIKLSEDKFLFGNQMCQFSENIWKNDLIDGDFPFKITHPKIKRILDEIHSCNSKKLESEAYLKAVSFLGDDNVIQNLKKFNIISKELPQNPPCGEIDVLCINPMTQTLFVFEAKNILQRNRPYDIKQTFDDFFGSKGKKYYEKLNRKHEFVNNNIKSFVEYFNKECSGIWKVKKAFVVDKRVFAAYHNDYHVDFILISEIANYLKNS